MKKTAKASTVRMPRTDRRAEKASKPHARVKKPARNGRANQAEMGQTPYQRASVQLEELITAVESGKVAIFEREGGALKDQTERVLARLRDVAADTIVSNWAQRLRGISCRIAEIQAADGGTAEARAVDTLLKKQGIVLTLCRTA